MKRTPFIGVGPGRCGTTSLAHIVGACCYTRISHENKQYPWYEQDNPMVGELIKEMHYFSSIDILRGEVSCTVIRHIAALRSAVPGMKVVRLHRDKESCVDSWMNYGLFLLRRSDRQGWLDRECMGSDTDDMRANNVRSFPIIEAATPRQALEFWWEYYNVLMEEIADPVFDLGMEELNNDTAICQLFDFLEIPDPDRRYIEKRKYWTAAEVEEKRKLMRGLTLAE